MVKEFYSLIKSCIPDYAKVSPFKSFHIDLMNLDEQQQKVYNSMPKYSQYMEAQANYGYACTILVNGIPYAVFGFVPLWKGVAECWLLLDNRCRTVFVPFSRSSLRIFDEIGTFMELKRLQMYVVSKNFLYNKYAKFCKFNKEGLLKYYGPDLTDYNCYGRYY